MISLPTPTQMFLYKEIRKACSKVSQAQNPVQWQFTMSTAALPPVNSITTTNQAWSPSINTRKTTANKTALSNGNFYAILWQISRYNTSLDATTQWQPYPLGFPNPWLTSGIIISKYHNGLPATNLGQDKPTTNDCVPPQQITFPDKPDSTWQSTEWMNWI